jgi:hypothetical protein
MGFEDRRAKRCDPAGRDDGRVEDRAGNCGNVDVLDGNVGVPGVSIATEDLELSPSKLAVLKPCGIAVEEQALRLGKHGKLSARASFLR